MNQVENEGHRHYNTSKMGLYGNVAKQQMIDVRIIIWRSLEGRKYRRRPIICWFYDIKKSGRIKLRRIGRTGRVRGRPILNSRCTNNTHKIFNKFKMLSNYFVVLTFTMYSQMVLMLNELHSHTCNM